MTERTKLLTSCARNDAAWGRLLGLLSTVFLFGEALGLATRHLPASSGYELPLLELVSVLALAALVTCVFRWLRQRLPDFARGYRSGSLIAATIWGMLLLLWNIQMISGMIEDKGSPAGSTASNRSGTGL